MQKIQFDSPSGLRLVGDVLGPLDGAPVLLLHGGGQTRASWKNSIDIIAGLGYRCYSIDARGHGESDHDPNGDYTPEAYVSDLNEIVRQVGPPVALIGASLGGVVSLLVAGEGGPAWVSALALVDVAARTNPYGVARVQDFMRANPDGFANVEEAADAVARYAPHRPRPRNVSGLERNLRKVGDRFHWHWDSRFLDSWHVGHQASAARLEAAARNLRIPVLVIHAEESDVIGPEEIDHLRSLAPQAEYVRVEKAGHMVVGDNNSAFNQAVINFLARHVPPAADVGSTKS